VHVRAASASVPAVPVVAASDPVEPVAVSVPVVPVVALVPVELLLVLPARTSARTAPQVVAVVVVDPAVEPQVHSAVVAERARLASRSVRSAQNSS
jgi:hypothetical protein